MNVVVDASVIIEYLRLKDPIGCLYSSLIDREEGIILSLITLSELYSGKKVQIPGKQQDDLKKILIGAEIVIPERTTAMTVGLLRAQYAMSLGDAFIAALAMERELPIATLNDKDFRKVREVRLYELKSKK